MNFIILFFLSNNIIFLNLLKPDIHLVSISHELPWAITLYSILKNKIYKKPKIIM